jgi:hypothetical protein
MSFAAICPASMGSSQFSPGLHSGQRSPIMTKPVVRIQKEPWVSHLTLVGNMIESGSQPIWLSVAEAARLLGITETAVRKRIGTGKLLARGDRGSTEVQVSHDLIGQPSSELSSDGLSTSMAEMLAGEVAGLRAHLADIQQERDRWYSLAMEAREEARNAMAAREAAEREIRLLLGRR